MIDSERRHSQSTVFIVILLYVVQVRLFATEIQNQTNKSKLEKVNNL